MNAFLDLALIVIVGLGLGGVLIWLKERRPRLANLILGVTTVTLAVSAFRAGHHGFYPLFFAVLAVRFFYDVIWNREASTQN